MTTASPAEIADRLAGALKRGGETYALALGEFWSEGLVDLSHEPPLPQDAPTDLAHMLAERRMLDQAFHALMPDFRHEQVLARVVGQVVYLFCDQVGTLADGTKIVSPLCSRFTIQAGRIEKVVLGIDPVSVAPLQAAFGVLAAAQKKAI